MQPTKIAEYLNQLRRVVQVLLKEQRCLACSKPFLPLPEQLIRPRPWQKEYFSWAQFLSPQATEPANYFCRDCLQKMPMPTKGFCLHCGELAGSADLPLAPCGDCLKKMPPWQDCLFYGSYDNLLRELLIRYKFHGHTVLSRALASLLLQRIFWQNLSFDALVPIPLHPARLRSRGYNQALEIALALQGALQQKGLQNSVPLALSKKNEQAEHSTDLHQPQKIERPAQQDDGLYPPQKIGLPAQQARGLQTSHKPPVLKHALIRKVDSRPQVGLSRTERTANTKGIFEASPCVHGKSILLIDDIYTTGATLRSACQTLLGAGAKEVSIAIIAHTQHKPKK